MEPEREWDGYLAFAGEDPLAVDFDLQAEALLETCPALLRVELEIVAPDDVGFPAPPEMRLLASEEDELGALLEKHDTGGSLVARTTCRGARELFVALPEAGRADYALRKWGRKLEREVNIDVLGDGAAFLREHLLPGPDELRWMAARDAVVEALESGANPEAGIRLSIGDEEHSLPLDPFAIAAVLKEAGDPSGWSLDRS